MRLAPYMSRRSVYLTAGYAALWLLFFADWLWLGPKLPGWSHWTIQLASLPVTVVWMLRVARPAQRDMILVAAVASCSYVFWWQLTVFIADSLVWDVLRAYLAWLGTAGLFLIGLASCLAQSPSVPVAAPPHSEAWRARSGGETCKPLIPHASGEQIAERGLGRLPLL